MKLHEYQAAFLDALYGDRGKLLELLAPAVTHRFSAYAGGLPARFEAALTEAFPKTAAALGHERFHALSAEYAYSHPSTTWDLGRIGAGFPAYASTKIPAPLADLCSLEWIIHEVFFVADSRPTALAPADPDALVSWRPVFAPTVRLFESAWPVYELWKGPSEEPNVCHVMISRDAEGTVRVHALSANQFVLQKALMNGEMFGDALDATPEITEQEVSSLSAIWMANRLLRA